MWCVVGRFFPIEILGVKTGTLQIAKFTEICDVIIKANRVNLFEFLCGKLLHHTSGLHKVHVVEA